jgi:glutathionyl-hydroquinone reductase
MGLLVDGVWQDQGYDTKSTHGRFVRAPSRYRNWVTADGAAGPTGEGGFPAATQRYHLYVSLACPWAHRTLIFRKLKKLDHAVSVSIVEPLMLSDGWVFGPPGSATADPVNGKAKLADVYVAADPKFTGRVTVPVLWDRARHTIVNNESSEIIRMFNTAFDAVSDDRTDYYPAPLRDAIDAVNATVYDNVNNGVYRTGFATTQAAYEEAFLALFATLDALERRLGQTRYLVGDRSTEADWRLFTTLIRFDAVYVGQFKCNQRRIVDYPNLSNYLRDLYQTAGIAATVDMHHIKRHYYCSHRQINPTGIVPLGPALDFAAPHDRGRFSTSPRWRELDVEQGETSGEGRLR